MWVKLLISASVKVFSGSLVCHVAMARNGHKNREIWLCVCGWSHCVLVTKWRTFNSMERRNCEVLLNYVLDPEILLALTRQQMQWTCNKRINLTDIMAKETVVGVALSRTRRNSENDEECLKNIFFPSYTILILSEEYYLSYKLMAL